MNPTATVAVLLAACGAEPGPGPVAESVIPADYSATFTKVRSCLPSVEHATVNVVVLASPDALGTYQTLMGDYPENAMFVKEEYASSDPNCTGALRRWTVGQKRAPGSSTRTLDWHWQEVDAEGVVTKDDDRKCISCHEDCVPGGTGGGYGFMCSAPGE